MAVLVVGGILGGGIYILVGEVAAEVGGMVWLPFLVAFVLAALTAASYVELVTRSPHAAGAAHYVDLAFARSPVTFLVGFVVAASAVSTGAAASRAVGSEYLRAFADVPVVPVALGMVVLLSLLNWVGIAESARVVFVTTAVEAGGLVLVIVAGAAGLFDGSADPGRLVDTGSTNAGVSSVFAAAALAFFAYLGFEDAVQLSEEVRDPRRAYPRALFGALAVVGVLYLGVALSVAALVEPSRLAASSAPLLRALDAGPVHVPEKVFALVAIMAVTNTALLALTTASRQVYGLAEKGSVPAVLGRVGRRRTPTVAIIGVGVIVGVLASTGDVRDLADTTVVLLLGIFAVVNVTVLVLRRGGDGSRGDAAFRAPIAAPVLGAVGSGALLLHTLAVGQLELYVRLAALLGLGLVLYASVATRRAS